MRCCQVREVKAKAQALMKSQVLATRDSVRSWCEDISTDQIASDCTGQALGNPRGHRAARTSRMLRVSPAGNRSHGNVQIPESSGRALTGCRCDPPAKRLPNAIGSERFTRSPIPSPPWVLSSLATRGTLACVRAGGQVRDPSLEPKGPVPFQGQRVTPSLVMLEFCLGRALSDPPDS